MSTGAESRICLQYLKETQSRLLNAAVERADLL